LIKLVDSTTNEWSIEITDITKEQRFKKNFFYNSSRLSAEWIIERPTLNNSISTLADFGNTTFTDANATMDNDVGTISNFPFAQVTMHDRQNRPLVTVSSLTPKGSSFTINYLSATSAQSQLSKLLENIIAVATFGGIRETVDQAGQD